MRERQSGEYEATSRQPTSRGTNPDQLLEARIQIKLQLSSVAGSDSRCEDGAIRGIYVLCLRRVAAEKDARNLITRMDPARVIEVVERAQLYKILFTCNAVLFLYEYLITIGDEIELMWSTAWSPAVFLYGASRYLAVPEICAEMIFIFGDLSTRKCRMILAYAGDSVIIGMLLGQGIVILRTWALWNDSRCISSALMVIGTLCSGVIVYRAVGWAINIKATADRTVSPYLRGCAVEPPYHLFYIAWLVFCSTDIAMICLTVIKYRRECAARSTPGSLLSSAARLWRGSPDLTSSLYREAFTYFTAMLSMSIRSAQLGLKGAVVFALSTIAVSLTIPGHYRILFYGTERILYTSLACRIMLNLRAAAKHPSTTIDTLATNHAVAFWARENVEG